MSSALQDVRYAVRLLLRSPGFTAVMVLTLALGIGANTAIFSYVDATWLRPLPAREPDRLVRIFTSEHDASGDQPRGPSSYVDYLDLRTQAAAFSDMLAFERRGALLYGPGEVTRLTVEVVSPNYFTALGIQPIAGRVFSDAEAEALNEHPGVVISYELWRQQFGGDPAAVGKQVRLTNAHVAILGVMPRGFRGLELHAPVAAWVPTPVWSQMTGRTGVSPEFTLRGNRRRDILGRLNHGITLAQAQTELDTIGARLAREYPATNKESKFTAVREIDTRGEGPRRQGTILLVIALAVALIASANLANLQLARAEMRRRETATRLAIGGGRLRLVRQWMTESLLLSLLGCAFAILLAKWVIAVLPTLFASGLTGGGYDFRLDPRALLFTIAIGVGTTILLGLAPALQASRVDVTEMLRGATTAGPTRRGVRVRDLLVVGQVAASLVLLVAAGLLVRTFAKLEAIDPGFNARQNVLLLYVVPELTHRSAPQLHEYYRDVQERLGALAGVQQASLVQRVPFSPFLGGAEREIVVPGLQPPAGRTGFAVNFDVVGPGYFSLMGTRLMQGRVFGAEDGPEGMKVAIVNQTMARRFWPGRDAVGQRLQIAKADYQVVGIVEDAKWESLTEAPRPLLYFPMTQQVSDGLTILLRTGNDPAALVNAARAELRRIDANVPLLSAITLKEHMESTLNDEHNRARLVSAFAALGLLIAAVGLYGVLAFVMARRTREIGIRIAVGAEPGAVFRLVLDYALRRVLVGVAVGLAVALALRRAISGLLYGVSPVDPLTFGAVLALLVAVGLIAALVPARRATKVDPIVALRME